MTYAAMYATVIVTTIFGIEIPHYTLKDVEAVRFHSTQQACLDHSYKLWVTPFAPHPAVDQLAISYGERKGNERILFCKKVK